MEKILILHILSFKVDLDNLLNCEFLSGGMGY
jgi:hypothetical protein